MRPPVERDLVVHLAQFGGALRARGVAVRLSDEADALAALTLVDLGDRAEVERALRAALKIRPGDLATFAELFARFWTVTAAAAGTPPSSPTRPAALAVPARATHPGTPAGTAIHDPQSSRPASGDEPSWSPEAVLRRKAFDECSPRDLPEMERLLARLARRLATRPSRRRVPATRGEVDLRRSLRRAVGTAGEPLVLARRRRAIERPRLVFLCDTSGSMDPHLRFLLAFLLALRRAAPGSEVFAFNTGLVRLTPWLRRGDQVPRVLARVAAAVPDWSGGTRIGECLAEFVDRHLGPLVGARTVVVIVSDGLDRGDVAPVAAAMRAIRRRARRVYWLNPLAGDARYQPSARAMAAALPHLDRLLPAHNLESLARLLPLLAA